MFLDEARVAARLRHPNIAHVLDVGHDGQLPYIATEFLHGQALSVVQARAIDSSQRIPIGVALQIVSGVLEALEYAHGMRDFDGTPLNMVHRDATPSNIFVEYGGRSRLLDFGIAKTTTQREKTGVGMIKGKLAYLAPEQLTDEPVDRRADVWTAGVVLWELLAARQLFSAANDSETVVAVMRSSIPRVSDVRSDVPAGLDDVLSAALVRNRDKRMATAAELKARCDEVAKSIGVSSDHTDVSNLMKTMFPGVEEHNRSIVNAVVGGRELRGAHQARFLRVAADGRIERHDDVYAVPRTGDRLSMRPPGMIAASNGADRSKSAVAGPRSEPPVQAVVKSNSVVPPEADERGAPAWQWVALMFAVVGIASVAWWLAR
jgi:serine/threonine-protein kinase